MWVFVTAVQAFGCEGSARSSLMSPDAVFDIHSLSDDRNREKNMPVRRPTSTASQALVSEGKAGG